MHDLKHAENGMDYVKLRFSPTFFNKIFKTLPFQTEIIIRAFIFRQYYEQQKRPSYQFGELHFRFNLI